MGIIPCPIESIQEVIPKDYLKSLLLITPL